MKPRATGFMLVFALGVVSPPLATEGQEAGRPSVQALIRNLQDPDDRVRLRAALDLMRLGPAAKDAVPALVEAMRGPARGPGETQAAGPPCPGPGCTPASRPDAWVGPQAASALSEIGPDAVPALIQALRHADPAIRRGASTALGMIRPAGKTTVLALARAVQDPEAEVQRAAIQALHLIGAPLAKNAVPELAKAVRDPDLLTQARAAQALESIDPAAAARAARRTADDVPGLVQALKDSRGQVRQAAADSLGRLGPASEDAVPALVQVLERDPDIPARRQAALALGQIGPASNEVIPALVQALRDVFLVRGAASVALSRIGADAVPALIQVLAERTAVTRDGLPDDVISRMMYATEALGRIGPPAKEAIPALRELASLDSTPETNTQQGRGPQTELKRVAQEALRKIEGR